MTNIIYFPGFRSTGKNIDELNKLGNLIVVDYPSYDPKEIESYIDSLIETLFHSSDKPWNTVIYGESYGGYWSIFTANNYNLPCIVLNPSLNIRNSGMSRASSKEINYIKSFDGSRFYRLCNKYIHNHRKSYLSDSINIYGFVCLDDKVVKPDYFIKLMEEKNKEVHRFKEGGHSGQKHFQIILDKIKETISELS